MIDLNELERALKDMQPRQRLYEIIKAEMVYRGRWKQLARGKNIRENLKKKS